MQGGLVDDRSDQQGCTIVLKVYGQAPKPLRPAVVEVTPHSKTIRVAQCPNSSIGHRHRDNLIDVGCPSHQPKGAVGGVIVGGN